MHEALQGRLSSKYSVSPKACLVGLYDLVEPNEHGLWDLSEKSGYEQY